MSRKNDLLKLFSKNTEFYFHIIPNELGQLIYITQEKDEYTIEGLEFKLNSIIEGFFDGVEKIGFEKVAPSIYFTEEKNSEKLKYELGEDMMENLDFSTFIENIKETYRALEVEDYLLYKKDPEAYEKKKEKEHKQEQLETWERYKKQVKEQKRIKKTAIEQYDGDLVKLFKDNLLHTIIEKDKKFNLKNPFSQLVYSILTNNEDQAKFWPKREGQTITGNDKFDAIEIEGNSMTILIADRMSDSHIIKFKLVGPELIIDHVVNNVDKDTKHMADYDFLMKIFNFDITPNFIDWENMYENEKLDAVVDEIIRLDAEEKEKKEKEKNEIIDSSTANAFFTIDEYEVQINETPDIVGENISDKLFKIVEDKVIELKIDFKRGINLNNIEFIETITYKQTEKIYNHLIENGYMLDTYRQKFEYSFMDLRKPSKPTTTNTNTKTK